MTSASTSREVICPHCKKHFRGELLEGRDERHRGFKCPHCRLFVPYARVGEEDLVEPAAETS
jgi:DNA-directed RNA polymerase subunit RPC12/RpoP